MALGAIGSTEFNELLSATIQKIEKQLVDNVLVAHPTLDFFKKNVKSATGPSVVIPIVAADDSSTSFTDASGTFNTDKSSDILGVTKYDWAEPLVSKVRVEFKQLEMNSGPEAVVSLAKAHLDAAVKGHGKKIATVLHTAGSAGAGAFLTLDQLIAGTDKLTTTSSRTIGGIRGGTTVETVTNVARSSTTATVTVGANDFIVGDSVVVAGLTNTALNGTYTLTAVGSTTIEYTTATSGTIASGADSGTVTCAIIKDYWKSTQNYIPVSGTGALAIRDAFRKTADDVYVASGERVNAIICGRDIFTEYESSFDDKIRYNAINTTGESRFRELEFEGIPVRLDPDCPANRAYFLNTDYLVARYLGGNFMRALPAQVITGTLDTVTPLASVLLIGTSNRRAHGKLIRTVAP